MNRSPSSILSSAIFASIFITASSFAADKPTSQDKTKPNTIDSPKTIQTITPNKLTPSKPSTPAAPATPADESPSTTPSGILPLEAGKIASITTPHPAVVAETADGIVVPFTINGTGAACTLQMYPHNQQDPQPIMVGVDKFPVTVKVKFPHKQDDYKMLAWGTGVKACGGTADTNVKVRIQLAIPKIPTITGLFVAPVVTRKAEAWRQDEAVDFYVSGNVKNNDDAAMQCGWTLFMVNSNGQGKKVTTGSKFTMGQIIPATFFSAYEPGEYTLRVKSSAADDTIANQDCKGEASHTFKLLRATATIKDVQLKSFGQHFNMTKEHGPYSPGGEPMEGPDFCKNCTSIFSPAHDIGGLRITPVFAAGQTCSYSVIQKFNGQQNSRLVVYTPSDTMSGIDAMAPPKLNVYSDNKTTVQVTLVGAPGPGGPCEGTVTKTITVHDDPNMQAVTK